MTVLKLLAVAITGILSLLAARHVMRNMEAAKVRVRPQQQHPRGMTRLRQDPRTGVYYPEN